MRASMAMQRQEEKGAVQERAPPKHRREDKMESSEPEEPHSSHRNRNPKPANKPPGEENKILLWCFSYKFGLVAMSRSLTQPPFLPFVSVRTLMSPDPDQDDFPILGAAAAANM